VYVSCVGSGTVVVLSARTGRRIGKPIRVGAEPFASAAGAGYVWVANAGSNSVSRIDPEAVRDREG
jgi:DNA-binding beta-propeller fold protein YncE